MTSGITLSTGTIEAATGTRIVLNPRELLPVEQRLAELERRWAKADRCLAQGSSSAADEEVRVTSWQLRKPQREGRVIALVYEALKSFRSRQDVPTLHEVVEKMLYLRLLEEVGGQLVILRGRKAPVRLERIREAYKKLVVTLRPGVDSTA